MEHASPILTGSRARPPVLGACGALCAAVLLAGCSSPVLYDTDLRPIRDPLLLASVPDVGWLAMDSTAEGLRAILTLHVEAPMGVSDYVALHVPRLACAAEGVHDPVRIRREPPVCWPVTGPQCAPSASGGPCPPPTGREEVQCVHIVRAEYAFRSLPRPRDEIRLTFGQEATSAVWTPP